MQRREAVLGLASAALLASAYAAGETKLQPVADLQALATESARSGAPVIVLFSTPGCPYCREVRESYLAPRLAEQRQRPAPQYLLREVDITSRRPIGQVDGRAVTEAQFADRNGVRLVPVLIAFDAQWRPLGPPLVGLDRAGFYESYLERLIGDALSARAGR